MTCNWIRSLLDNQSDCTKFHGEFYFLFLRILASVIQGSVIGPASMSCTPEICNQSPTAMIWWSTQMTPILSSLKWTMHHAKTNWSTSTNGRLNQAKTVEIVFYARGRHRVEDEQPPSLPGILRVTVSNNLSMAGHVSALLDTCARTLYGLRVLRAHGLHQDCLDEVFRCTVLAKLMYASPAW